MPDFHHLLLFIAAGWLLNLTPGPDVFYIATHALRSGVRAGIVAGLGITAGCFVHVAAAALGVGALLATSATAFSVLKWVGAAYLVWMGVRMLRARPGGGLEVVRAGVVQQQKRRQRAAVVAVAEQRAHGKAVAHPVAGRGVVDGLDGSQHGRGLLCKGRRAGPPLHMACRWGRWRGPVGPAAGFSVAWVGRCVGAPWTSKM